METPARHISRIYCCPECGGEIDYRKTVNNGRMWFCMRCTRCTSFESKLKRIREEPVEEIKIPVRPELTEEERERGRKVLMNILV